MKKCYLTIDDGPSPDFLKKIYYLHKREIPAVFFCIGKDIAARTDLVVEAIRLGFIIGNHSYTHPHFSNISLKKATEEIIKTDLLIDDLYLLAGVERKHKFFRFPYGDKGDWKRGNVFKWWLPANTLSKKFIQSILKNNGYTHPAFDNLEYAFYKKAGLLKDIDWHWTFDVMEWSLLMPKPLFKMKDKESVFARILHGQPHDVRGLSSKELRWVENKTSAEIVLLHDHAETATLFPEIIEKLISLNLMFCSP